MLPCRDASRFSGAVPQSVPLPDDDLCVGQPVSGSGHAPHGGRLAGRRESLGKLTQVGWERVRRRSEERRFWVTVRLEQVGFPGGSGGNLEGTQLVRSRMMRGFTLLVLAVVGSACARSSTSAQLEDPPDVEPAGTALVTEPRPQELPSTAATEAATSATAVDAATLTLHVSNQSFADDPVTIMIRLDGKTVVDDEFYVLSQHNWITFELPVASGDHELRMTSSIGVEQTASIAMPAEGALWAVVDYWFYPDAEEPNDEGTVRSFTFTVDDEPIYFA